MIALHSANRNTLTLLLVRLPAGGGGAGRSLATWRSCTAVARNVVSTCGAATAVAAGRGDRGGGRRGSRAGVALDIGEHLVGPRCGHDIRCCCKGVVWIAFSQLPRGMHWPLHTRVQYHPPQGWPPTNATFGDFCPGTRVRPGLTKTRQRRGEVGARASAFVPRMLRCFAHCCRDGAARKQGVRSRSGQQKRSADNAPSHRKTRP